MAQRTIHYLFGEIFSQHVELKDKKRFLLGSVLPDAFADVADRDKTHFKHRMPELNKTYFDFDKFKAGFCAGCGCKDDRSGKRPCILCRRRFSQLYGTGCGY